MQVFPTKPKWQICRLLILILEENILGISIYMYVAIIYCISEYKMEKCNLDFDFECLKSMIITEVRNQRFVSQPFHCRRETPLPSAALPFGVYDSVWECKTLPPIKQTLFGLWSKWCNLSNTIQKMLVGL